MEPLIREATADTPKVHLDAKSNIFEISRMSLPEDAIEFYEPVVKWLEQYKQNPNIETTFSFKLEYFNTASSKQIIQILLLLQDLSKKNEVTVKWYYKDIDEDMEAIGEEYSQVIDVKFELIEYK
jgi:predicted enzyme related to lactoylglutathione lyase